MFRNPLSLNVKITAKFDQVHITRLKWLKSSKNILLKTKVV